MSKVISLLETSAELLQEVPELIGSDSPACHRVKVALGHVDEAVCLLKKQVVVVQADPVECAPVEDVPV